MSELGRLLNEARTHKDLSLADVEAVTRIRQKFLEALETGDYAAFPRGAIGRGFLRNYARFLGLDVEEVLRLYQEESGDRPPALRLNGERPADYRPLEVDLIHEPSSGGGWRRWAIAIVVVAVIGAGGWGLYSGAFGARFDLPKPDLGWLAALGPQRATVTPTTTATATRWVVKVTPTPPAAPGGQAAPTSDLLPYPTPTVATTPTATATLRPTATPEVVARIQLTLRASQRSWIRVVGDGKVIEEGLIEVGQEKNYEAQQSIFLRTGNAGGVELTLNGQNLGAMGTVGQVVDRSWVVQAGQVAETTPSVADAPGAQAPAAPAVTVTATPAG